MLAARNMLFALWATMPIRQYMDSKVFDPETIRVMSAAFQRALTELKIEDRKDPRA
jgi:hypothetical protein